jgi:hypothetical protein
VPRFFAATVAPGTAAPDWSATVPDSLAETWAVERETKKHERNNVRTMKQAIFSMQERITPGQCNGRGESTAWRRVRAILNILLSLEKCFRRSEVYTIIDFTVDYDTVLYRLVIRNHTPDVSEPVIEYPPH